MGGSAEAIYWCFFPSVAHFEKGERELFKEVWFTIARISYQSVSTLCASARNIVLGLMQDISIPVDTSMPIHWIAELIVQNGKILAGSR